MVTGRLIINVPTYEDASFGEKFDPNFLMFTSGNHIILNHPSTSKTQPWVNTENGPITFFETPISLTNSIEVTGGGDF
jgi:hypothetical protein